MNFQKQNQDIEEKPKRANLDRDGCYRKEIIQIGVRLEALM
jgi:hypothetical protein